MTRTLRGRESFRALKREGRRVRRGPVTVTYLADRPTSPPRVGYAIGRAVGSAVTRNRVRRRLRAIVDELSAEPGSLPGGAYLIGSDASGAGAEYEELKESVAEAIGELAGATRR